MLINLFQKNLKRLLVLLPVLFLTTGCSKDDASLSSGGGDSLKNSQGAIEQATVSKILAVDNYRCTGCGKCSRFDPEHFSFNSETRKAVVVSQDNLESNDLRFAISACQDRAIALK